jgi:glyoxylase I family protein
MSVTRPFAIRGIDHVVLRVRDAPALIAFYADTLGCPVERTIDGLTQLRAGNALIDIVARDPDDAAGSNMDHLCLTLDAFDAEGIAAWLGACGVAIGEIATRYGAGGYGVSIYLTDPAGNGLELRAAAAD